MSKWMEFIRAEDKPKTKVYTVWSKCGDCKLGTIGWYPPWRHYCFFPDDDIVAVYSDRCLLEISEFVTKLNDDHKTKKKQK